MSAVVLGFTVFGLLFGYAVAALLAAGVGLLVLPGGISIPKRRHFKKLLSFAQYSWMSNLSTRAFTSMDTIVLGLFVSSGLIGIYEIAWNLASILAVFGQSISRSLFPELSRLSSDDQFDTVSKRLTDGIRFTGLLLLPGLVGGMLLGDRVLAIYGSEFSRGHLILVILIGARMLYAYSAQFITTLDALDRPEIGFRINGTFVVTNVVLNILLIWQFGWLGAAVATAISAVLAFILSYRWAIRILDPSIPLHSIGKQVIASLVMGFALYPVLLYWSPGIVMTGVLVAGGATIYFGVLATIAPEFRSTVRANLPVN